MSFYSYKNANPSCSTDRLPISTSMVLDRQDSKVMGGTGADVAGAVSVSLPQQAEELQQQECTTCA